jgi:hypothetical protein
MPEIVRRRIERAPSLRALLPQARIDASRTATRHSGYRCDIPSGDTAP